VTTWEGLLTPLLAARTGAKMAVMGLSLRVVTTWRILAQLSALGRFGGLLPSTRDRQLCGPTVARNVDSKHTGVATACMAGSIALVVPAAKSTATNLLTRRTVSITALGRYQCKPNAPHNAYSIH